MGWVVRHTRADAHGMHPDLHQHFQKHANTGKPWEHANFRFTHMLSQTIKDVNQFHLTMPSTLVRVGNLNSSK